MIGENRLRLKPKQEKSTIAEIKFLYFKPHLLQMLIVLLADKH
jgi:hypothetical protein